MAGPVNNASATHHEHPTPKSVIDAAREVMGGIDLDPASSKEFNEVVGAKKYYTKEDDGYYRDWGDNYWGKDLEIIVESILLNPPGSQSSKGQPKNPSCHLWLDKLVQTKKNKPTIQAIYIGYNGPETLSRRPWHCRSADAVLWTSVEGIATREEGFLKSSGRMTFASDRPYFPSIILYFGWNSEAFKCEFAKFGTFLEVQ